MTGDAGLAAQMAREAHRFAELAAHASEPVLLDGTPPSLVALDVLVAGGGDNPRFDELVLAPAAACLGEVVVRSSGGQWVANRHGWWAPGVLTRTGFVLYPVEAVHRRAHDPSAPQLTEVYGHAMAGAPVPEPHRLEAGTRFGEDLQLAQWSWATLYVADHAVVGRRLTWDPASLDLVEEECEHLASRGPLSEDEMANVQLEMGAYVGEVIRLAVGGRWELDNGAPGLRVSPRVICFPLSKVRKRIEDGPGDDVRTFYEFAAMAARGQDPW